MSRHSVASDTADLVVVGAGIVGLGAAYAAVRRGLRVVVVDRTASPIGATIRNFGHLCIGAQTGLARDFADTARDTWLRLSTDAGFWLRESGTLIAASRVDELAVRKRLRAEHRIEIGGGLGSLAGRVWRIGLMGEGARDAVVDRLLDALRAVLSDQ